MDADTDMELSVCMDMIGQAWRILSLVPLEKMRDTASHHAAFGVFRDPTAMMQPHAFDKLRRLRNLADAAIEFRDTAKSLAAEEQAEKAGARG